MFSTILLLTLFAADFITAEGLVTTIVGFLVTTGLTQWLKNATGAYGTLAFFIAVAVAFVVAAASVVISSLLNSTSVSWETLPAAGLQIFALATATYKLVLADKE